MANEKPEIKSVVEGAVKASSKFSMSTLMHDFIQEDIHTVTKSIFTDVIYPKTKQMIYDALVGAVSTMFWGVGGVKKTSNTGLGTRVNYAGVSSQKTTNTGSSLVSIRTGGMNPSDYEFENASDVSRVFDSMLDILEQYRRVTVLEFYELCGLPCDNYTLKDYGWDNLSDCKPRRNGNGTWSIPFPRMKKL